MFYSKGYAPPDTIVSSPDRSRKPNLWVDRGESQNKRKVRNEEPDVDVSPKKKKKKKETAELNLGLRIQKNEGSFIKYRQRASEPVESQYSTLSPPDTLDWCYQLTELQGRERQGLMPDIVL